MTDYCDAENKSYTLDVCYHACCTSGNHSDIWTIMSEYNPGTDDLYWQNSSKIIWIVFVNDAV